jgi:transposase
MKDEISSDSRSQRGLAIAKANKDSIKVLIGAKYLVPSAASNGSTYVVDTKAERCSCLDWSRLGGHDRPHRCKHIWACIHVVKLADGCELIMDPTKPPKKKRPRNRKAENACRTLIPQLAPHFCEQLVDGLGLRWRVPGQNGCPGIPLRDVLLTALIRAFENLTAAEAVVRVAELRDLGRIKITQVPSYNTLLRVFADPEHMALLHKLLAGSALPLLGLESVFAIDATGFGTSVYDHHFTQKHGKGAQKRIPTLHHRWGQVTLVFGLETFCVPAAQVTEQCGESPLMPELIRRVPANGGRVKEWLGDAAYNAWYNVVAAEEIGAVPFYDWPERRGKIRKPALKRLHDRFEDDQDLYWEKYSPRTLAESGVHSIKARFGHSVRSRVPHAIYAELMLRLICHNVAQLITAVQEFEVDPRYWAPEQISNLPDFGSAMPPESALARVKATKEIEE